MDQAIEGTRAVTDLVIRVDDDRTVLRRALAEIATVGHLSQLFSDRAHPFGEQLDSIPDDQFGKGEVQTAGQCAGTEASAEEARCDRGLPRHSEKQNKEREGHADEETKPHHPNGQIVENPIRKSHSQAPEGCYL